MSKNKQIKKIFAVGGLLLLAVAIWVFVIKSWGSSRYSAGSEDPAVIMAANWIEYIENGKIDKAKSITTNNPDTVITPYQKALSEIGKISTREISQRNFFPSPSGDRIHQVTFNLILAEKNRRVSERIFIAEGTNKKLLVAGTRFIVPLPTPSQDGESYTPDMSAPENPAALTINWFNNFDSGKLELCSKFRAARDAFNGGMFFFQEQSLPANQRIVSWLNDLHKAGLPIKRETVGRMIWHGLPGMPMVDIVMIRMTAEYAKGKRSETLWLFKDNFIPNRGWHIYNVAIGTMSPNDKNKKPSVNDKNKKPAPVTPKEPGIKQKT